MYLAVITVEANVYYIMCILFNRHDLIKINVKYLNLSCSSIIVQFLLVHKVDPTNVICELFDYVYMVFKHFACHLKVNFKNA